MAKIIITYRLKLGADAAEHETWTRTRDYPAMRGFARVASFVTHRAERLLLDPDGKPSVDYVELLDIPDLDGFMGEDFPGPAMQAILGEFAERADNAEIVVLREIA
jgi:hypothetical protein